MNTLLRLALWAIGFASTSVSAADRPNILWLVTEDNVASTVGPYGDPLARTPNVNKLAKGGIVFERCYSTSAVCAPTRSSIITGRFASGMGTQHMRSTLPLPVGVKFFPEYLRAAGYFTSNNAKTDYNTSTSWAAAWNENSGSAHWRHRAPGQPFFAVFNFQLSHEYGLHNRVELLTDPGKVRVPAYLPDTPTVRADIAQYYDIVASADAALGSLLAELKADGLAEDTIIFYYSDHGGAVSRSKRFLYENGTHTPLVAHFPEKYRHLAPAAPNSRVNEMVNLIDLAPTVLSLAGVPLPAQFQGRAIAGPARKAGPEFTFSFRDRMDERYDLARAVTDGRYRYIRNYYPSQPWGQHIETLWKQASMEEWAAHFAAGKLNATQRAFFENKPVEELFDCTADPDNVVNLATEPSAHPQLLRMRAALRAHQLSVRDTGFMPEPLMVAWAGNNSPSVVAADETRYPLARILDQIDALQLAAQPDPAALESALHAPQAVLRYWGAVAALRSATPPDVTALLDDAELVVRLAAAEVILFHGENPAAWAVVEAALKDASHSESRLFALNVVTRLPRTAPAEIMAVLRQIATKSATKGEGDQVYAERAAKYLIRKSD